MEMKTTYCYWPQTRCTIIVAAAAAPAALCLVFDEADHDRWAKIHLPAISPSPIIFPPFFRKTQACAKISSCHFALPLLGTMTHDQAQRPMAADRHRQPSVGTTIQHRT
jgi:hypothetical protein